MFNVTCGKIKLHAVAEASFAVILLLQSSTNGDIQIILRYNPSLSELSGLVVKATNLKKMDVIGLSGENWRVAIRNNYKNIMIILSHDIFCSKIW